MTQAAGATVERDAQARPAAPMALLPLLLACIVALGLTIYPQLAMRAGRPDHMAAMLAMASMSTGFVRGVGFVPRRQPWRAVFSTPACLACAALAALRLWGG